MICHRIYAYIYGGYMSQADDIRSFVKTNYIDPAREKKAAKVSIRAGDVHKDMALSQSLPAVCCAIGTNKFEKLCNISRVSINGPINGANTTYTFEII
jgi:5-methylcytosine-specific restriction protein B